MINLHESYVAGLVLDLQSDSLPTVLVSPVLASLTTCSDVVRFLWYLYRMQGHKAFRGMTVTPYDVRHQRAWAWNLTKLSLTGICWLHIWQLEVSVVWQTVSVTSPAELV